MWQPQGRFLPGVHFPIYWEKPFSAQTPIKKLLSLINGVLPTAYPDKRTLMKVVYLGSNPGKHMYVMGSEKEETQEERGHHSGKQGPYPAGDHQTLRGQGSLSMNPALVEQA